MYLCWHIPEPCWLLWTGRMLGRTANIWLSQLMVYSLLASASENLKIAGVAVSELEHMTLFPSRTTGSTALLKT